jgi:regulator of cell morphogenesis and NO signaling
MIDMTVHVHEKTTVRELVGRHPQTRLVFEKFGIDYCCGGGKPLADAARECGQELPKLIDALNETLDRPISKAETAQRDWYSASLGELIRHIVDEHHTYMKTALPRLRSLISAVLKAHAAQHGDMLCLVQVNFNDLDEEISSHLMKEEQVLFPYITALEMYVQGESPQPQACFGSARYPIQQMEHEHESAGQALAKMREVTHDYALPTDACPTFRAMYEELERMEADLHQHIHLENNILFPRAIELEGVEA